MKKNVPDNSPMIIKWLPKALDDLEILREYIENDNPSASEKVIQHIIKSLGYLIDNPELGRPGRIINTRELLLSGLPYVIVYKIKNNFIEVLRVFHGAMKW